MRLNQRQLVLAVIVIAAAAGLLIFGQQGADAPDVITPDAVREVPLDNLIWHQTGAFDEAIPNVNTFSLRARGERLYLVNRRDPSQLQVYSIDGESRDPIELETLLDNRTIDLIDVAPGPDGSFWAIYSGGLRGVIARYDGVGALDTVFGERGDGTGQFRRPTMIRVGPDGTVYVMDSDAPRRILVWGPDGTFRQEWRFTFIDAGTTGFTIGQDGNVYLYERNNPLFSVGVDVYAPDGEVIASNRLSGLEVDIPSSNPAGRVTANSDGDIITATLEDVFKISPGGSTVWQFGTTQSPPEGAFEPGEIINIRDMVLLDDGTVVVLDGNREYWQMFRLDLSE